MPALSIPKTDIAGTDEEQGYYVIALPPNPSFPITTEASPDIIAAQAGHTGNSFVAIAVG